MMKRKFYYGASLLLLGLLLTQLYQLTRHLQIIPGIANGIENTRLDIVVFEDEDATSILIKDDLRKQKTHYPITWFNPVSKMLFDMDVEKRNFLSINFLRVNFTYPTMLLFLHTLEILFTFLIFLFCLFNRRHYTSTYFDTDSTFTQITNLINKEFATVTSPSIRVAKNRRAERWYLFKDETKLGPYTLNQVEYLAEEKTKIKEYMCMSTFDHRVYKVKNIIDSWDD